MQFEIPFSGHQNVRSLHGRTIEITTEPYLTPQGDCIVGVGAASGCAGIPEDMKARIRNPEARITITIRVGDSEFVVRGRGHRDLELSDMHDIVIRTSGFVCPRTLAVRCDRASDAIPRGMVQNLQDPDAKGTFTVTVYTDAQKFLQPD